MRTGKILSNSPEYIVEAHQMLEAKKWSEQEIEIQRRIDKAELIGRGIRSFARKEGLKEGLKEGKVLGLKEGQKQGLQKGIRQGIQQGIDQGAQDKAMEVAKNLFEMGLSLEQISKGTGLSIDKIKELINNHEKYSKN